MDIITKYIKVNSFNIVGIFKKEMEDEYRLLSARIKQGKLVVSGNATYHSLEELFEAVGNKLPVILVFEGKGILEKEIDFAVEADANWYRNIDFKTIMFTSLKSNTSTFMSFCRKKIVDEFVEEAKNRHLYVLDVYVGSFLGALLQPEVGKKQLVSNGALLSFDDNSLSGFSKYSGFGQKYKIGKDEIMSEMIPLYGALLHYIVRQEEVKKSIDSSYGADEVIYRNLFNRSAVSILAFFFLSLLCSYAGIQYFGSKNAELTTQNVYSGRAYEFMEDLQSQKKEKMEILNQTGLLTSKFLSFYAYEIINTAPAGLNIAKLVVSPAAEDIKEGKQPQIISKKISIYGTTSAQHTIDNWLKSLNAVSWLENVEVVSVQKEKTGITYFEIMIKIKNV